MTEPRLKAGLWASAALRRAHQLGRSGMVLRRGDADAGGILVVLRDRDGRMVVLAQARTLDGEPAWTRGTGAAAVDQEGADAYVARQLGRDPDLWVLEIEGPDLVPPFKALIV